MRRPSWPRPWCCQTRAWRATPRTGAWLRTTRGGWGTRGRSGRPGPLPSRRLTSMMCTSKYQVDEIRCQFKRKSKEKVNTFQVKEDFNTRFIYTQSFISYYFILAGNFTDSRYRPWPRVKQFLMDLEPGSFVCDVGELWVFYQDNIIISSIILE